MSTSYKSSFRVTSGGTLDYLVATIDRAFDEIEQKGRCPYCGGFVELDRDGDRLAPRWRCKNGSSEGFHCPVEFQTTRSVLAAMRLLCGNAAEKCLVESVFRGGEE